jgi:hypothetical protein
MRLPKVISARPEDGAIRVGISTDETPPDKRLEPFSPKLKSSRAQENAGIKRIQ